MQLTTQAHELRWRETPQQAIDVYRQIREDVADFDEKRAYSEGLRKLTEYLNITPGTYPGGIPNAPSPLAATLTGGLVGAGLGYGAGTIAEHVLPERWRQGRLRKTLTLLGGAGGAIPGVTWAGINVADGRPWNDSSLTAGPPPVNGPSFKGLKLRPDSVHKPGALVKFAYQGAGSFGVRPVNINEFNQVVWDDPRVAERLPISVRAAATGLVQGAAELSGNNSGWVTPYDIAQMTAGMGVGYASGALVGKGLGLLMGMPQDTQENLKNIGYYAGAVSSLISTAFGH